MDEEEEKADRSDIYGALARAIVYLPLPIFVWICIGRGYYPVRGPYADPWNPPIITKVLYLLCGVVLGVECLRWWYFVVRILVVSHRHRQSALK